MLMKEKYDTKKFFSSMRSGDTIRLPLGAFGMVIVGENRVVFDERINKVQQSSTQNERTALVHFAFADKLPGCGFSRLQSGVREELIVISKTGKIADFRQL